MPSLDYAPLFSSIADLMRIGVVVLDEDRQAEFASPHAETRGR